MKTARKLRLCVILLLLASESFAGCDTHKSEIKPSSLGKVRIIPSMKSHFIGKGKDTQLKDYAVRIQISLKDAKQLRTPGIVVVDETAYFNCNMQTPHAKRKADVTFHSKARAYNSAGESLKLSASDQQLVRAAVQSVIGVNGLRSGCSSTVQTVSCEMGAE